MGKKVSYFPFRFMEALKCQECREVLARMKTKGLIPKNSTERAYVDFVLSKDFLRKEYDGPYKKLNQYVWPMYRSFVSKLANVTESERRLAITEIKDYVLTAYLVDLWGQTKQSYQVDPSFFEEIMRSERVFVSDTFGKYMPYRDVYVDLKEVEAVRPICGAFVHVTDENQIAVLMVTQTNDCYSYYSNNRYENHIYEFPKDIQPSTPFSFVEEGETYFTKHKEQDDHRKDIVRGIYQIIMFLSSEEPDIRENAASKRVYRPVSAGVSSSRNRFSDVRVWDVGYRYGSAIRLGRKEAEKEIKDSVEETGERKTARKSPRPHVRCAHWARYHVGKGRTELRWKWILPSFVNAGTEKNLTAVIHKVTD
ncbi:MAG: hypothetical protein Q4B26_06715 [Eubacteriales bacterium]|nr:hypothetical protein [Eubacteriales bacterium]